MSQQYVTHVTSQGERWDQIADRYYGDPRRYEPIILANPSVAITPTLDAGLRLAVPLMDTPDVVDVGLPPWKR